MAKGAAGESVFVFFVNNNAVCEASIPGMVWRVIPSEAVLLDRQHVLNLTNTPWSNWEGGVVGDDVLPAFGRRTESW